MRKVLRVLRWVVVVALLLCVLSVGGGYFYLRRSLPQVSGVVKLAGLSAPVEVIRDKDAVPHIYARSKADAFFGLGYVHAQDRLWQMDFQRRVGQGRLSEIVGAPTVTTDRFIRATGVYRAAQSAWETLPAESRAPVEAYVAGINAFLASHGGGELPPEFTVMGVKPEPWGGPDVLLWAKMMALNLGNTFQIELTRMELTSAVGAERAAELLPDSPPDDLSIVQGGAHAGAPAVSTKSAPARLPRRRAAAPGGPDYARLNQELQTIRRFIPGAQGVGGGVGSNSWVLGGSRSAAGKPLLANDPHLEAQLPSVWYLAHLSAEDLDVIGATIPGLPGVIIGRNPSIAWGVTNLYPDTQDLYRERLDAAGQAAEFKGQMEPMLVVNETIKVKDEADVQQVVRFTRHGPLISDAFNAAGPRKNGPMEPLALRWTALDPNDQTIASIIRFNSARNWDEFKLALSGFVAPALSFVYADTAGNIGFYGAGRFPVRGAGDGSQPAEGWSGKDEWAGWVPPEAAPQLYNPPQQLIVTANNRPVPGDYPYLLGRSWEQPYRAQRITELLSGAGKADLAAMARVQADTVSLQARELVPLLLELTEPQDEDERKALELLRGWDYDMGRESAAAAIFAAWYRRLPEALLGDELDAEAFTNYGNWGDLFIRRFLATTLRQRDNHWCDATNTPAREDCGDVARQTLKAALQDLRSQLGGGPEQWRWGRLHRAVFFHQPFGYVDYVRRLFNRSAEVGGDNSTVNLGAFGFDPSFEQHAVSGYRQIIDLGSADTGQFLLAVGQSGHVLSAHYDDYLEDWQAVRYRPMRLDRAAVLRDQEAVLRLEP